MAKSHNALQIQDIKLKQSSYRLKFRSFKHHIGDPVKVKVKANGSKFCPIRLMNRFLVLRGSLPGQLFCWADGTPMTYALYSKLLKEVVSRFDLDPRIKPHSARIGAATFAAMQGVPEAQIKRFGRWGSSSFRGYIRVPVVSL